MLQFHIDAMVASACRHSLNLTDFHLHVPQVAWYHNSSSNSMHIQRSWAYWSTLYDTWAFLGNRSSFPSPFKWELAEFLLRKYVECNDIFCVAHSQIKPPKKMIQNCFFFNTWPDLGFLQCPAYNLRTLLYVDPNLNPWFKCALSIEMGISVYILYFYDILCMIRLSARFWHSQLFNEISTFEARIRLRGFWQEVGEPKVFSNG